jgi:hypothetical protein
MIAARWLVALAAAAPVLAAAQCDAPGAKVESDASWSSTARCRRRSPSGSTYGRGARVREGRGPAPTALRVDADMPAHRHGMNYRAKVSPKGEGRYVAEGLLFHMPGQWRLLFDVDGGGRTERLAANITLE